MKFQWKLMSQSLIWLHMWVRVCQRALFSLTYHTWLPQTKAKSRTSWLWTLLLTINRIFRPKGPFNSSSPVFSNYGEEKWRPENLTDEFKISSRRDQMPGLLKPEYYFTETHGLILSSELPAKATTLDGQTDNFYTHSHFKFIHRLPLIICLIDHWKPNFSSQIKFSLAPNTFPVSPPVKPNSYL